MSKGIRWNQGLLVAIVLFLAASFVFILSTNHADAATKSFSDLKEAESGYDEVMSLVDKGIIDGYEDGTFKPYRSISREHISLMLTDALHLKAPSDLSKALADYKDINEGYVYAEQIAAVTEEDIFKGDHGNFYPRNSITRAEMATVLVRTFQLEDNGTSVDLIDLDEISATHRENVKILAQNGITIGKKNKAGEHFFDAQGDLKRVQFAIFLERALHVSRPIDQVTDDYVTIDGIDYEVSEDLAGLFNEGNSDALKGAKITFETAADGKISAITTLELTNSGTNAEQVVLDAGDTTVDGHVIVHGNYVSIENVTIENDLVVFGDGFEAAGITVNGETVIIEAKSNTASLARTLAAAENSVVFSDSILASIVINRNGIDIDAQGETTIGEIIVSQNATVNVADGIVVSNLVVTGDAEEVELNGEVTNVEINTNSNTAFTGNANVENITVDGTGEVQINSSGSVASIEVKSKDAKITIQKGTNIGNIVLPEGANIDDVIENYDNVKDQIDQINGEDNPDATSPGGGSGGGPSTVVEYVSNAEALNDAVKNEEVDEIRLAGKIDLGNSLDLNREVIINGQGNTLNITTTGNGDNSAEGIWIHNAHVTLKNLTVAGNHGDNLIEIYSDATLENVTVKDGNKAGIYVNNDGTGKITVNFKDITTSGNKWGAGIGLVAQKTGSEVVANFSGTHSFGEEVAVYKDADLVEGENKYKGTIGIIGLDQNKYPATDEVDGKLKRYSGDVTSKDILKTKLNNDDLSIITIKNNLEDIDESIKITRPVQINGESKTITFTNDLNKQDDGDGSGIVIENAEKVTINDLTVEMVNESDWEGLYAVQVYKSTGVTLSNFAGTNADAALLVNGSEVELTGEIDVSGNEFGGIEVSKVEGVDDPVLNILSATLSNESEELGKPTIWEDEAGDNKWVTYKDEQFMVIQSDIEKDKNQRHYYLIEHTEETP